MEVCRSLVVNHLLLLRYLLKNNNWLARFGFLQLLLRSGRFWVVNDLNVTLQNCNQYMTSALKPVVKL